MKTNSLKLNESKPEAILFVSAQQLKKIKVQALRVGDCLVRVTHSVRNLGVQFDAEMTIGVACDCCKQVNNIPPPQHLDDQMGSDSSSDRASHTWICYKPTRCWQCTATSTDSEANITASDSPELGSPLDRRRYEI